jgi:hypothetical protein
MNAVLIITIFLIALTAFSIYCIQSRRLRLRAARAQIIPPRFGGLFADQKPYISTEQSPSASASAPQLKLLNDTRAALLARAAEGDHEVLREAARFDAYKTLYGEVLDKLTARALDNPTQTHALAAFIARNDELRGAPRLAERLIEIWQAAPDKSSIALMLHTAALSNDAAIYERAIETLVQCWREERLPPPLAEDLRALIESEYWLLAPEARSSGAGFVLKQTMARACHELAHSRRETRVPLT